MADGIKELPLVGDNLVLCLAGFDGEVRARVKKVVDNCIVFDGFNTAADFDLYLSGLSQFLKIYKDK